jgi:uncharacterized protein with HEPN domain
MQRDARVYVADALAAGDLIASFTAGRSLASYESDEMLRSAVERQFEIMGEALRRLTELDPAVAEAIPVCRRVIAFRNQLAHGYFAIQNDVVWAIATNDLEPLLNELRTILARYDSR